MRKNKTKTGWPGTRRGCAFAVGVGFLLMLTVVSDARDFFSIENMRFLAKEPRRGSAVYRTHVEKDARGGDLKIRTFLPCLEAIVEVQQNVRASDVLAKVYYFDPSGRLLAKKDNPNAVTRGESKSESALPALLEGGKKEGIYFEVPESVLYVSDWRALVVFGDKLELCAAVHSASVSAADRDWRRYDFPEKEKVGRAPDRSSQRKAFMDPVVTQVVRTRNETQPQITLLMRPPKGVTQGADVKGVMALCLLANSVDEIRDSLIRGDHHLMQFADANHLAIIAWGSRRAWELAGSYHNFDRKQNRHVDVEFEKVAGSWERGIRMLVEEYGIPDRDYLMWAASGAANWAHRLALRRPGYFAAVHVEILSTHDRPTVEASRVMWLLTTGELEGGYESSLRFYKDCRGLGYPMLYKAYPGIGHASCPQAQKLGLEFFRLALQRVEASQGVVTGLLEDREAALARLRFKPFVAPPYYGDIVNQESYPNSEVEMIPPGFRTPLPDQNIADAWKQ